MELSIDLVAVANLAVAGLAGLAVGIERERSGHASGPGARFAGVRTFFLLGLLGGIAGTLQRVSATGAAVVLLVAGGALVIAAYLMAARRATDGLPGDAAIDGTTEAAAIVVLGLGVLAGLGHKALASGIVTVVVVALGEKARIQELVRRIGDREMRAALQFAVLALVILPLLPDESFGPLGGIRPRTLWSVVLLFSGISFAGYLARKSVGAARGYAITGLLGGLISSTAVTLAFSRRSRDDDAMSASLGYGVVGACAVMLPRVALVSVVLNPRFAVALIPYLLSPALVGAGLVALGLRRSSTAGDAAMPEADLRSPLGLGLSLRMALAFQVVLMAIVFIRDTWGGVGVLTSAFLLGLTDMDALTMAMNRMATYEDAIRLGALAIGIGIMANTMFKLVLTVTLGSPRFRRVATLGLLAYAAAGALGIWLGTR